MPRYDERSGPTRLYVGHISKHTRSRDLEDIFSKYGRVRDVDMKHDFAFVDFSSSRDADDARHYLNGRTVDGSRIVVEFARRGPRGGGGGGGGSRDNVGRGPAPGAGRCYNCGHDGHWARDCKAGDWKNKCYRCGQRGHIERNCNGSPRGNRSTSRSQSRSPLAGRRSRSPAAGRRSRSPAAGRRSRSPVAGRRSRSPAAGRRRSRSRSYSPRHKSYSRSPKKDASPLPEEKNQSPSRSRTPVLSPVHARNISRSSSGKVGSPQRSRSSSPNQSPENISPALNGRSPGKNTSQDDASPVCMPDRELQDNTSPRNGKSPSNSAD